MRLFFSIKKDPHVWTWSNKIDFEFVGSSKFVESYVSVSREQQGATEAGAIGCR